MKRIEIGHWIINFIEDSIKFGTQELSWMQKVTQEWAEIAKFDAPASEQLGCPSSLIRLDMIKDEDGKLNLCEVEERPSGLGVSATLNKEFFPHLKMWWESAGQPSFFVSEGRMKEMRKGVVDQNGFCDDFVVAELLGARYKVGGEPPKDGILHIRSLRSEIFSESILRRCLTSTEREGDKSYLITMGLATQVSQGDWASPFVVKLRSGSRMEGVRLWHPDKNVREKLAFHGRKSIEEFLSIDDSMVQPFYRSEIHKVGEKEYFPTYRFYWYWMGNKYHPAGGMVYLNRGVRGHATPETICLPLIFG